MVFDARTRLFGRKLRQETGDPYTVIETFVDVRNSVTRKRTSGRNSGEKNPE